MPSRRKHKIARAVRTGLYLDLKLRIAYSTIQRALGAHRSNTTLWETQAANKILVQLTKLYKAMENRVLALLEPLGMDQPAFPCLRARQKARVLSVGAAMGFMKRKLLGTLSRAPTALTARLLFPIG